MSKEGCVIECGFNPQQVPNKTFHRKFSPLRSEISGELHVELSRYAADNIPV
jgi:hypothetical protein